MDYEINLETSIIMPIDKESSKIIENGEEYIINYNSTKILEHSCEYFGSSLEGRKEGTKKLLGITHKSPIIVEESRKIIFFPTTSPDRDDCTWINLSKVANHYKTANNKSAIQFKDGTTIEFDVSYGSLSNQIYRASRLKYVLDQRIAQKEDNIL